MGDVSLLALRRLRAPLIALILAYAISVFGLTLMPGIGPDGEPYSLGIFHAFYVISYTATTIGFGELPYPFTDAQRAWTIFSIYLSVTCWAYALGSIISLVQDKAFRAALARSRFTTRVRRLEEPFIVIAGYGQSGRALAHAFDELDFRTVIIEERGERADAIDVEEFRHTPLVLSADARLPDIQQEAGIAHRHCRALVVLVGDDEVAQAIAIGAAVAQPALEVIARVHDSIALANLDGFGNVHVIDPFATFANNLSLSITSPAVLWVEEWLTSPPESSCPRPIAMPPGHWVICGFGRFGHAMVLALEAAGSTWTAIDDDLRLMDEPHLQRSDNSEDSLRVAGVDRAVGLIAGTERDAINLALVSRARRIKPELRVLIRQNQYAARSLIEASRADLAFVKSDVMLRECLQLLISPLLNSFLLQVRQRGNELAEQIIVRLLLELDERVPYVWVFDCLPSHPGLRRVLQSPGDTPLLLRELLIDPTDPPNPLCALPLLLQRGQRREFMPGHDTALQTGDRILFAGASGVESCQRRFLMDPSPLEFVRTGIEPARSWLFRRLARARTRKQQ
ncbi:MAG: NAD-binding protein [Halioglobus sp.]|nr:NAD-binding protein [Halioglobus sp.]